MAVILVMIGLRGSPLMSSLICRRVGRSLACMLVSQLQRVATSPEKWVHQSERASLMCTMKIQMMKLLVVL